MEVEDPFSEKKLCAYCDTEVPTWFVEDIRYADGASIFGGLYAPEYLCRHCAELWPYPEFGEDEDRYVCALLRWKPVDEIKLRSDIERRVRLVHNAERVEEIRQRAQVEMSKLREWKNTAAFFGVLALVEAAVLFWMVR